MVKKATKFKVSKFLETKGGLVQYLAEYMYTEKERGYPIKILRQDNAKENIAAIKHAHGSTWKLTFGAELTARKTPQQNLVVETGFTVLAAQARSMMNAVQIPAAMRFTLWAETVMTATNLKNLSVVTINGVTKTHWEHAGFELPSWSKYLRTYVEARTVKEGKNGKVLDQGVTMLFIGYSAESPKQC